MARPTNWLIVDLFRVCCIVGLATLNLLQSSAKTLFAKDSIRFATGLSKIDLTDLKRHVSTLASDALEGREAGSRGGKAAAAYIRSELKALRVVRPIPRETSQEFGRDYQNLLLFLPGSDNRLMHEIIVVGAHYDHVGYGNSSNSQGPLGQIHNGADKVSVVKEQATTFF